MTLITSWPAVQYYSVHYTRQAIIGTGPAHKYFLCSASFKFTDPAMYPYTPYPLTPIGNFIGFVLSVIPFVLYLNSQTLNTGICMNALWISIMTFKTFVNTIVWHNNVDISIPVWCDIGA